MRTCVCQPGYGGPSCDAEKQPAHIQITHIALQGYMAEGCTNFDSEDGALFQDADLYLALYYTQERVAYNRLLAQEDYNE